MKLASLFSSLRHEKNFEAQIAQQLPGGFDVSGIHAALLQLKLIKPKGVRGGQEIWLIFYEDCTCSRGNLLWLHTSWTSFADLHSVRYL